MPGRASFALARLERLSYPHGRALAAARSDADRVQAIVEADGWLRGYLAGLRTLSAVVVGFRHRVADHRTEAVDVRNALLLDLCVLVSPRALQLGDGVDECRGCGGALRSIGAGFCGDCEADVGDGVRFPWVARPDLEPG